MSEALKQEAKLSRITLAQFEYADGEKNRVKYWQKWIRHEGNPDCLSTWTIKNLKRDELIAYLVHGIIPAEKIEAKPTEDMGALRTLIDTVMTEAITRTLGSDYYLHQMHDLILAELDARAPREIRHVLIDPQSAEARGSADGRQHYLFPLVLRLLQGDPKALNLYLWGPAGSGKSTMALNAARALGYSEDQIIFYPLNIQTSKADIEGYNSADGTYIPARVVDGIRSGKMIILDEFDRGNAAVLTLLNGMIANRIVTLPSCETIKVHSDTRFVASGNTPMQGATTQYQGASAQDGATADRFAFIHVGYDEGLESLKACGKEVTRSPECILDRGGEISPEDWVRFVVRYRKAFSMAKMDRILSPRASFSGAEMIRLGIGKDWLIHSLVRRELTEEQWGRVDMYLNQVS